MPIYEYECKACGHRLEKLQKISADPLIDCPACEAAELTRLVSAAGFRLAGAGWYETDFKSGDKRNLAGDAGGETSSSPDKATEKAPAAKSDEGTTGKASGKDGGKQAGNEKGKDTTKAKTTKGGAAA
jgi:putative FmdB family regulatory protein